MTGHDIINRAAILSGRPTADYPWGQGLHRSALAFVDTVAQELWYAMEDGPYLPLDSLADELAVPAEAALAMAYGVATLFARASGDLTAHTLLAAEYDRHRATIFRENGRILDRFGEVIRCDN